MTRPGLYRRHPQLIRGEPWLYGARPGLIWLSPWLIRPNQAQSRVVRDSSGASPEPSGGHPGLSGVLEHTTCDLIQY